MNLDFSQCETKEDVEKVFKENKKQISLVRSLQGRT